MIESISLSSYAPELGAICIVTGLLSISLMNKVGGKFSMLRGYLANQPWKLFKSDALFERYAGLLSCIARIYIFFPLLTLGVWVLILFFQTDRDSQYILPICTCLVMASILLLGLGIFLVKWNNYKPTCGTMGIIISAFIFFVGYQVVANFINPDSTSYFGLSSLFLCYNGVLILFIIFLNSGESAIAINQFVDNKFEEHRPYEIDLDRDFEEEIAEQWENQGYLPHKKELSLFYTIPKTAPKYSYSVLTGGLQSMFTSLSTQQRRFISTIAYTMSLGILVAYSLIVYQSSQEYGLGILTSIAVVSTDIILYLYGHSNIAQNTNELSLLAILFRICLFAFGADYWIYGYSVLYLLLGLILAWATIKIKFPLIKGISSAFMHKRRGGYLFKHYIDITKYPQFVFWMVTFMLSVFCLILEFTRPGGVPLKSVEMGNREFNFYIFPIFALLFTAIAYCFMGAYRIYTRKKKDISGKIYYYVFWFSVDIYWIYILATYFFIVLTGLLIYAVLDDQIYLILAIFIPAIWVISMNAYTHYVLNDYNIFKDIQKENTRRAKLRVKSEAMKKRISVYKKRKIAEGKSYNMDLELSQLMKEKMILTPKNSNSEVGIKRVTAGGMEEEKKEEEVPDSPLSENSGKAQPEEEPMDNRSIEEDLELKPSIYRYNKETRRDIETEGNVLGLGGKTIRELKLAMEDEEGIKELEHWREKKISSCSAFCGGKFHRDDYHVLFGFILYVMLSISCGGIIEIVNMSNDHAPYIGITVIIFLFGIGLFVSPMIKYLITGQPFCKLQVFSFLFGFIMYFVWGIIFLFGDVDSPQLFLFIYIFALPLIISLYMGIYRLSYTKWKIQIYSLCMLGGALLLLLAFGYWLTLQYSVIYGVAAWVLEASIIYIIFIKEVYVKNNFFLPKIYQIITLFIVVLVCFVAIVMSLFVQDFNQFIGFSITYLLICLVLLGYALSIIYNDLRTFDKCPIFYSPFIFPIYKYMPGKENIRMHNNAVVVMYASIYLSILWGVLLSVYLSPMYIGVTMTTIGVLVLVYVTLFFITYTPHKFKMAEEMCTDQMLKSSWLHAKKHYVETRNSICLGALTAYHEVVQDYEDCAQFIAEYKAQGKGGRYRESIENRRWNRENIDIISLKQLYHQLYALDQLMLSIYFEEIKLMIHFQLLLMISALTSRKKQMKVTFGVLKGYEVELKSYGIKFKSCLVKNQEMKYSLLLKEINSLPPEKYMKYMELKHKYEEHEEEERKKDIEREEEQERKETARLSIIERLIQEKRRRLEEQGNMKDIRDIPLDQLADSQAKYTRIISEFKGANSFVDNQFPPNDTSLGPTVSHRGGGEWRRAVGMSLYQDSISPQDVQQGSLGDCYFLSAISVIGGDNIKNIIITKEGEQNCGAFLIKFYRSGDCPEYIIIDDLFPTKGDGSWLFCTSESGQELWPMVLEKAYAKFYGSYENIEGGKVQLALADLTGGAPQELKLEEHRENIETFWTKLLHMNKENYYMGVGSPEHEHGDRAVSASGIVQGHAYALLDIADISQDRLIQLRNPHGSKGAEWNGDWSDLDDKWTAITRGLVNYIPAQDDGVFWLSLSDFLYEFKNLYICRTLDPKKWSTVSLEGEWKGESAGGLPCRANPGAKMENNPQWALKIVRPTTILIKMRQTRGPNMMKGELPIYFMMQNNNGKRISKNNRDKLTGHSGKPTDLRTITGEIILDNSYRYPRKFTLMCATTYAGERGEGNFSLKLSCNSKFTANTIPLDFEYID